MSSLSVPDTLDMGTGTFAQTSLFFFFDKRHDRGMYNVQTGVEAFLVNACGLTICIWYCKQHQRMSNQHHRYLWPLKFREPLSRTQILLLNYNNISIPHVFPAIGNDGGMPRAPYSNATQLSMARVAH